MLQIAVENLVRPNRQKDPLGFVPLVGPQKQLTHAPWHLGSGNNSIKSPFSSQQKKSGDTGNLR
jgi:hypothetical protein